MSSNLTPSAIQKKHAQLGMNPGKAANRLVKDLLFAFVAAAGHTCFRCGGELTRQNFSIEHKERWLDSADPVKLFFDLQNIAYSHKLCNTKAGRKKQRIYVTEEQVRDAQRRYQRECNARSYTPEKRRDRYLRTGN